MKFLKSEYDSLKLIIESSGLNYADFSFVKKRGVLNVIWTESESPFSFYRKKETVINEQMQFEEKVRYFVGPKKEKVLENWEQVLAHFKEFLKQASPHK